MGPLTAPAQDVAHLIQSAVGPVFLISGVSVTLNVLTSRLARAVDRARGLERDRSAADANDARRGSIDAHLAVLARRARLINAAITLCTISALLTTFVVVLLFADAFVPLNFDGYVAAMFVASMLCLAAAFLVFLIEVRIATAALRIGGRET
jgi:hypothetical protein